MTCTLNEFDLEKAYAKMSRGRFKIDESWVNNPAPFIGIYTLFIGRNTRKEKSTNPTKYVLDSK